MSNQMTVVHFDQKRKVFKYAIDDLEIIVSNIQNPMTVATIMPKGKDMKLRSTLGKYAVTAYLMHFEDMPASRWVEILTACIELLKMLENKFIKDGKFKPPVFFGWLTVISGIVKFLKVLFNESE